MGKGSKSVIIGYAYSLGLALGICENCDELKEFRMDDDTVARPNLKQSGEFMAPTGKSAKTGGSEKSQSVVTFYDGKQTVPNDYLTQKSGFELVYRNLSYALINGFIGDNVTTAPNYHFIVTKTSYDIDGFKQYSQIGNDCNPAFALWYIMTNLCALDSALIDINSFKDTAEKLHEEEFGISFAMNNPASAKEWIEEILKLIDGVFFVNPKTGLITLKLLRNDYDLQKAIILNESNIANLKFSRKSWDDTYSTITLKFTNGETFNEDSLSARNPATKRTLGYEKATNIEAKAVTTQKNAKALLERYMRKYTYPYAALKFDISTKQFPNLCVGDVCVFSNVDLGIVSMPIRIVGLGGDSGEQKLSVEAVEDIFALDLVNFISFDNVSYDNPIDLNISELQFYKVAEATAEMGETLGVLPIAVSPDGFVQNITAQDGTQGAKIDVKPWQVARLLSDIEISPEFSDEVSFLVEEISELWSVNATRGGWQRLKMTCMIDDEFIAFETRKEKGDKIWQVGGLIRGLSDTTITKHKKGSLVYFAPSDANDLVCLSLISQNAQIRFIAHNYKNQSQTKTVNFTHSGKSLKAYSVSNAYGVRNGGKVTLFWRNRVRLHGANYRNCDNLIGGADEGLSENDILIEYNSKSIKAKLGSESIVIDEDTLPNTEFKITALPVSPVDLNPSLPSEAVSVIV